MELSTIETRLRQIKEHQGRSVKDVTIKNNSKMILKIQLGVPDNSPIGVWKAPAVVQKWVESEDNNFSKTTQRNYYSVMLAMANWDANFGPEKDESYAENFAEPIEFYIGMIKSLEKKILADKQARKVSDKKVEQQVAPSMVYDIIEGLKKNNFHEEAVILEILMKYPYRAEVGTLHFMHLKTYNALKKKKAWPPALSTGLKNYLIVGKRKMIVSRSDYKTFDTYGTIENEIKDKAVKKSLNEWIDVRKNGEGGWLGEMSPIFTFKDNQDVSKRLGYVTKKIAGISLGPAAIVKIMLSNQKFTDMAEAVDFLREASRIRGTALNVLQDVYLHAAKLED